MKSALSSKYQKTNIQQMRKLTNLTPPSWFAVALSLSIHLVDLFHLGYEGSLRHLEHKIFVSIL